MRVMFLAAIAGCGFSPAMSTPGDGPVQHGSDASIAQSDAPPIQVDGPPIAIDAQLPIDAPNLPNPYCTAPDQTDMVLCLEFDEPGLTGASAIAHDGSPGHHDATITNADAVVRTTPAPSPAQQISQRGDTQFADIQTADGSAFGLQTFTMMAWAQPTTDAPTGGVYAFIEKLSQWRLGIADDGAAICQVEGSDGTVVNSAGATLPTDGTWSFVACTYDGSDLCVYVNPTASSVPDCTSTGIASLNPGPSQGVLVGASWDTNSDGTYLHLRGAVDSARIFSRVMTATELTAASAL